MKLLWFESVNNCKSTKLVDDILKPDSVNYNEFELLEYDEDFHIFKPKNSLNKKEKERVKNMISTLCINLVKGSRKRYLTEKVEDITLGKIKTWQNTKIYQFPTAFEMLKRQYLERK